jgi:hypothetical protein
MTCQSKIKQRGPTGMIWEKDNFTISANKDHVNADSFYRKNGFEEMPTLKFMARNWIMQV